MKGVKINIPSYINEASYRYQMPRMDLKQESRGNGIKTNIYNLEDVAKALRVPPDAIMRFICSEIGAAKDKNTVIKGNHTYETLITVLDKFIDKYLLCKRCKYPETKLQVTKQRQLIGQCSACSTTNTLDSVHKAGAYLVKELPKFSAGDEGIGHEVSKQKDDDEENSKQADGGDSDVEALRLDSEEIKEKLDKINQMAIKNESNESLLEELRRQTISLGLTPEYKYYMMMCGLFNIGREPTKHFKKHETIFKQFVEKDGDLGQKQFFQALVLFYVRRFPDL